MAHENSRDVRQSSLREVYGFLVRPNPVVKKLAKGLGFMAPLLTNLLGSKDIKLDRDICV